MLLTMPHDLLCRPLQFTMFVSMCAPTPHSPPTCSCQVHLETITVAYQSSPSPLSQKGFRAGTTTVQPTSKLAPANATRTHNVLRASNASSVRRAKPSLGALGTVPTYRRTIVTIEGATPPLDRGQVQPTVHKHKRAIQRTFCLGTMLGPKAS